MDRRIYEIYEYPEGKTNYQILNEDGEKTTITLDKWVADILQIECIDVHDRIQKLFNKLCAEHPNLSRRKIGDIIRKRAARKASSCQETKKKVLGWNDYDYHPLDTLDISKCKFSAIMM